MAAVKTRFRIEQFAHDFAAERSNTKARHWFGRGIDALSFEDWSAYIPEREWGWLNPEFGHIRPWAERCVETGWMDRNIMLLTPAAVGSNWYREVVEPHGYCLFLNGRLHFDPAHPTWGYPKDCMLSLFGPGFHGYSNDTWVWRL